MIFGIIELKKQYRVYIFQRAMAHCYLMSNLSIVSYIKTYRFVIELNVELTFIFLNVTM